MNDHASPPARVRTFFQRAAPLGLAPLVALALLGCRAETTAPQREEPAANTAGMSSPPAPQRAAPAPAANGESWNTAQIEWQPYEAGLARAKAENKPVCLIFYTTWCPHCKNFSQVFDDPRVAERARDFVMIRLDADQESDVAARFAKDGGYIPRTFFLASDGTPDFDIHTPRAQYAYFYNERDPSSLLEGMNEAARKLRK
jgi:protein-disulfide reductase (glutathione)